MPQYAKPHVSWKNKTLRIIVITLGILAIPFLSTIFRLGANWSPTDFLIAGSLLTVAGIAYQVFGTDRTNKQRLLIGLAIALITLLIWIELSVGLIGSPLAGS